MVSYAEPKVSVIVEASLQVISVEMLDHLFMIQEQRDETLGVIVEVSLGESYPCFQPSLQRVFFPKLRVAALNVAGSAVNIEARFVTMG